MKAKTKVADQRKPKQETSSKAIKTPKQPKVNKVNGRPPIFNNVEELKEAIDNYFKSCYIGKQNVRPLTVLGLCVDLQINRCTLIDWEEKDYKNFSNTIKHAKARIESFAEESLFTNPRTAGVIFNMINNYPERWKNKSEQRQVIVDEYKVEFDK